MHYITGPNITPDSDDLLLEKFKAKADKENAEGCSSIPRPTTHEEFLQTLYLTDEEQQRPRIREILRRGAYWSYTQNLLDTFKFYKAWRDSRLRGVPIPSKVLEDAFERIGHYSFMVELDPREAVEMLAYRYMDSIRTRRTGFNELLKLRLSLEKTA